MIAVSGVPRSGTSMLMQMLDAGGIDIVTDKERKPDEDNPAGYYEFEAVKNENIDWAGKVGDGSAVKIISFHLPRFRDYLTKIILVNRNLDEVYESSNKMLDRIGKPELPEKIKNIWRTHINETVKWINDSGIPLLVIGHRETIKNPLESAREINRFLGANMDVKKMSSVVSVDLYRNKEHKCRHRM